MDYAAQLGEQPFIDPTASVIESRLGRYTEVLERSRLVRSELGDYSYLMEDCQWFPAGSASSPTWPPTAGSIPATTPWASQLHHFTYRSAKYGLGRTTPRSSPGAANQVVVGNDTWIGHGPASSPGHGG